MFHRVPKNVGSPLHRKWETEGTVRRRKWDDGSGGSIIYLGISESQRRADDKL